MREIQEHPILKLARGKEIWIKFSGTPIRAYENETVAMALYREGIDVFTESSKLHRPRGMFCAIGKCSSCMMRVNGIPNVRTCILPAREGMVIEKQDMYGKLPESIEDFPEPCEIYTDIVIVGAGPAGLSAANILKDFNIRVLLVEQNPKLGGQLIKQTHKFFGSENEMAGTRGFEIANILIQNIKDSNINYKTDSTAFGFYPDSTLAIFQNNQLLKVHSKYFFFATGASEKMIPFAGNDVPGVFGAGAAQTMMNVFGIKPGKDILMVGAGNVGLIVSYQLLQAGINVKAVIEAMPKIGGYFVHAAKLRRFGVPILTGTTIKEVMGTKRVEKAISIGLDEEFKEIEGSEKEWNVDTVCLSTGLMPSVNLLSQAGCTLKYVSSLGGYVPIRNRELRTSRETIYVAGDVSGIEEASTAMVEGKIASLAILEKIGYATGREKEKNIEELQRLREGPFSSKIVESLGEVTYE